jgi:hypothetical protein
LKREDVILVNTSAERALNVDYVFITLAQMALRKLEDEGKAPWMALCEKDQKGLITLEVDVEAREERRLAQVEQQRAVPNMR